MIATKESFFHQNSVDCCVHQKRIFLLLDASLVGATVAFPTTPMGSIVGHNYSINKGKERWLGYNVCGYRKAIKSMVWNVILMPVDEELLCCICGVSGRIISHQGTDISPWVYIIDLRGDRVIYMVVMVVHVEIPFRCQWMSRHGAL